MVAPHSSIVTLRFDEGMGKPTDLVLRNPDKPEEVIKRGLCLVFGRGRNCVLATKFVRCRSDILSKGVTIAVSVVKDLFMRFFACDR